MVGQIIINSLISGSLYALFALSFNLLLGTVKFFDVAYGARALAAGYGVYYFGKILGLSLFIAIPLGILLACLLGLILEKFIYRPLRDRNASRLVLLMAGFGAFIVIGALLPILFSSQFQTLAGGEATNSIITTGIGVFTKIQLVLILSAPVIFCLITLILKKTRFGKAIRAVSDDEEVAGTSGINTKKITLLVFVVTSAIAAVACILDGFDIGISPSLGLLITLKAIIAAIIGGIGSTTGGFLGGYILGGVENIVAWQFGGEWQDAVAFVLLIIFLIVRPRGILGKK